MTELEVDRVAKLVDMPLQQLRELLTGYVYYGNEPPTPSEVRWCTKGLSRGALVKALLRFEYNL